MDYDKAKRLYKSQRKLLKKLQFKEKQEKLKT